MEDTSEKETIREAMSILGSRTSSRKALAARENGKLGGYHKNFKGNARQRRKQKRALKK